VSLERHTTNQAMTTTEIRYQLVLDNLACLAHDPGSLPSFATVTDGIAAVSDTAGFDAKTALDGFKGFTGEGLTGNASRSPDVQWTMDPVHTSQQRRAVKAALEIALFGCLSDPNDSYLLKDFQVYEDLVRLPRGWLCVGRECDVPHQCGYSANCCGTAVWIAPGGLRGLSELTLILTDIATSDSTTLYPTATITQLKLLDERKAPGAEAIPTPPAIAKSTDPTRSSPTAIQPGSNAEIEQKALDAYKGVTMQVRIDREANQIQFQTPIVVYRGNVSPPASIGQPVTIAGMEVYWVNIECPPQFTGEALGPNASRGQSSMQYPPNPYSPAHLPPPGPTPAPGQLPGILP
jgi:hypothetical protein